MRTDALQPAAALTRERDGQPETVLPTRTPNSRAAWPWRLRAARLRANHTGETLGFPASGASVWFRGIDIFRCSDGKVVEHWGAIDMSDFMEKVQAAAG